MHTTYDDFLGGKVKLKQPSRGFRGTSDSVLLALFAGVKAGDSVLDVGCGTGIILACLQEKKLKKTGIDIQKDLIALAQENLPDAEFIVGDISKLKLEETFDCVITNPPYFPTLSHSERSEESRKTARHESVALKDWLLFCMKRIKPKGRLVCILPAERMGEAVAVLNQKLGGITVLPVFSKKMDTSAYAVILTGILNSKKPLEIKPPIFVDSQEVKDKLRGK